MYFHLYLFYHIEDMLKTNDRQIQTNNRKWKASFIIVLPYWVKEKSGLKWPLYSNFLDFAPLRHDQATPAKDGIYDWRCVGIHTPLLDIGPHFRSVSSRSRIVRSDFDWHTSQNRLHFGPKKGTSYQQLQFAYFAAQLADPVIHRQLQRWFRQYFV